MRSSAAVLLAAEGAAASRLPRQCVAAPAVLSRRATPARRGGAQRRGRTVAQASVWAVRRAALRCRVEALPLTRALRRQDAVTKLFDSGLLVAIFGAVWFLAVTLTEIKNEITKLETNMTEGFASMKAELSASAAGSTRAFRSVSLGLQQLSNGNKLTAFAGATPADVAALLRANGLGQYATALGYLTGAEAQQLSEAQLRALGVAEGHVQPLQALFAKQQ
jgi:hypothetical protein